MSKRKAGVNDIIFELDNGDIEISSDDESKETKIGRFDAEDLKKTCKNNSGYRAKNIEVINIDSSEEILCISPSPIKTQNGGKTKFHTSSKHNPDEKTKIKNFKNIEYDEENKQVSGTIILDEDIVVDSPSNSDLGVVGCENRTPLVTVRFRDTNLAHVYKKTIKKFLIDLLKSQKEDINESNTDNELDIWPEDLVEEEFNGEDTSIDDNLFFVDTDPCEGTHTEIPTYSQAENVISNSPKKQDSASEPQKLRWKLLCFNCDGEHSLRDCSLPRNHQRIADKRKNLGPRVGRYHVEDEQKYGHLMPGRISAALRNALGLKRYELPLHIYRMRLLGYPPGWLEEAKISHSGITLFDSTGNAILDPDEEEGEVNEPGSKDKFDIKKILDFPGFNVPASSRYVEEAQLFGLPSMSEQDSKMAMLQALAPNAVKAYKRKKLMIFPSNSLVAQDGQAEMELDSGDEALEFPTKPPLPDEAPPPPPTPPPPPPDEPQEIRTELKLDSENIDSVSQSSVKEASTIDSSDDLEVIEVMQVPDIPVPEDTFITIDEDYDEASISSGRVSPTLDDLEEKKRLLLSALKDGVESETSLIDITAESVADSTIDSEEIEELLDMAVKEQNEKEKGQNEVEKEQKEKQNQITDRESKDNNDVIEIESADDNDNLDIICTENTPKEAIDDKLEGTTDDTKTGEDKIDTQVGTSETNVEPEVSKTTDIKSSQGNVKTTSYGTPVLNISSEYTKIPSDDKFAKDICDVIYFENLPDSTGKYKKISTLLKKVKSEVDRIHDS